MAKSAYKNLYGFTAFAAAAGLALCLTTSGCSDDTSDPNPFEVNRGTVTYNYTRAAAKAADLPAAAVKATYTFSEGDALIYTVANVQIVPENGSSDDTKEGKLVGRVPEDLTPNDPNATPTSWNVDIKQVPINANRVSVMYFDNSGAPVGLGVDSLSWTSTTEGNSAVVSEPDMVDSSVIATKIANEEIVPQVVTSTPCVDKDEYIWVKPVLAYNNGSDKPVLFDLSGMATYSLDGQDEGQSTYLEKAKYQWYVGKSDFSNSDEKTTTKADDSETTPGYYKAVEYGEQKVTVSLNGWETLGKLDPITVYISDAQLTEVTIDGKDDVYVVAPNYDFGLSSVVVPGVSIESIPFNIVSFKAIGKYKGTRGPSFDTDASSYVTWKLTNKDGQELSDKDGVKGQKDALGHYVVTSTATSLKDLEVTAQASSASPKVSLHSLPAAADIKVNIAQEVVKGGSADGTVEGFFKVTTPTGVVETSGSNITDYSKVKIGKVESSPAPTENKATVEKNEAANGIKLTLGDEDVDSTVTFETIYKDLYKSGKAMELKSSTSVKVIKETETEDTEEPQGEGLALKQILDIKRWLSQL